MKAEKGIYSIIPADYANNDPEGWYYQIKYETRFCICELPAAEDIPHHLISFLFYTRAGKYLLDPLLDKVSKNIEFILYVKCKIY